ncbi:hypothetical protein ABWL39_20910 [Chitinivorax sp. PXF-14]|uniref:hypothetical protein n=1 Tax=Chitinivorax sp. PXF-14 TaxID=3230488 RepID=UPI003466C96D
MHDFRPEITTVIDIGTRRVVGFSVDLAESGLAVIDALRHAAISSGVNAICRMRFTGIEHSLIQR